jgi:carbon-monoxide dehydrogenase large subunit
VGEPVVAVVADDPYRAHDALALVDVRYDPLPSVTDIEAALAPGAPRIHGELDDNVCFRMSQSRDEWYRGDSRDADLESAFRQATKVIRVDFRVNRVAPVAMEPRGLIASFDRSRGELTVWASTQMAFFLRAQLAEVLGLSEPMTRIITPDVGGGFGGKVSLMREEVLVAWLAVSLAVPVKWVSTRMEDLVSTNHGRGLVYHVEAAADGEGHLLGLRVRILHTPGAYVQNHGLLMPIRAASYVAGPYRVRAVSTEIVSVFTNTSTTGPFRGTARPENAMMTERVMDEIAGALGIDPVEVRRRNLIPADALPYQSPTGVVYDSGDYLGTLNRAVELVNYAELRREQARARARGQLMGIGTAIFVEMSGTMRWQSATVRVERSGAVTVLTGSSPHGQGHETVWGQIAADRLGVHLEDIRVVHGDTAMVPPGTGTAGASGAPLAAPAVAVAADRVREKMLRIVAHRLESRIDDLVVKDGRIGVVGAPGASLPIAEVARIAYAGRELPAGMEPGLEETFRFMPPRPPFGFGAYFSVVRIDGDTGSVAVDRLIAVDDCGNVLNPLILEGQLHGSLAQGIGQALSEEVVYDDAGQPLAGSLMDYALLRADDLPELVLGRTETPTPLNVLGSKGGSESGNIGAPASIWNAVVDALGSLDARGVSLPLTPARVWRALRAG